MIMKFLKKIPAGMMVVPMLLGAFINTFFPQITGIGSFTTAIFTSADTDGGTDDELGNQQHAAALDDAANLAEPQGRTQAEQLNTDCRVGTGAGEDRGGKGTDASDLREESIDERAQ